MTTLNIKAAADYATYINGGDTPADMIDEIVAADKATADMELSWELSDITVTPGRIVINAWDDIEDEIVTITIVA